MHETNASPATLALERVETAPPSVFRAIAAVGIGLPIGGAILADGGAAWAFAALGAGAAAAVAALARRRRAARTLPLELAAFALRGRIDGTPVWRFRARLGRGRALRRPRAEVRLVGDAGEVVLETLVPADVLVGPFTIVARDPGRLVGDRGVLVVRVACEEAGRVWEAEARYDVAACRDGWFAAHTFADVAAPTSA